MSNSDNGDSGGCPAHGGEDGDQSLSYGSYLNVPELLDLQEL